MHIVELSFTVWYGRHSIFRVLYGVAKFQGQSLHRGLNTRGWEILRFSTEIAYIWKTVRDTPVLLDR